MELAYNASSSVVAASAVSAATFAFTNTAKLPIETVKRLIAAVSRRPMLWLRNNANGQKRSDITPIWFEVGQDVNLPADICRIKWGHLRDNFRKVYIRNNLSNETPSSWRFYNDMRFMEPAVHENIMRQTRSSSKKHPPGHWSENNNVLGVDKYDLPLVATEPICELSDSYDSELHQPSFSDISSFFEDRDCQPPDSKRIKLEPQQQDNEQEEMSGVGEEEEEEDDDDFDEDAASENQEEERGKQRAEPANPSVFTIEVLDDDDDEEMEQAKMKTNHNNNNNNNNNSTSTTSSRSLSQSLKSEPDAKASGSSTSQSPNAADLPFKYISMDAATNTEPSGGDLQDEADRMFLLSLMPFLQRLDERRRLRVRQKLQNVLIEELEFG